MGRKKPTKNATDVPRLEAGPKGPRLYHGLLLEKSSLGKSMVLTKQPQKETKQATSILEFAALSTEITSSLVPLIIHKKQS